MPISRREFVLVQGRKADLSELRKVFLTQPWCEGSSVAALLIFGSLLSNARKITSPFRKANALVSNGLYCSLIHVNCSLLLRYALRTSQAQDAEHGEPVYREVMESCPTPDDTISQA